jgi:hypothetical protein
MASLVRVAAVPFGTTRHRGIDIKDALGSLLSDYGLAEKDHDVFDAVRPVLPSKNVLVGAYSHDAFTYSMGGGFMQQRKYEWNCDRVQCMVTENASNMVGVTDGAVNRGKGIESRPCVPHGLQLCADAVLKVPGAERLLRTKFVCFCCMSSAVDCTI